MTITTASLPAATAGKAYTTTIVQAGGDAPVSFALTSGSLPTGLTLSTAGVLSGTPTVTGSFPIIVTATDNGGCPISKSYTLTVACFTFSPAGPALTNAVQNVAYTNTLTATGGVGAVTYSLASGTLPPGLSLVGNKIQGTVTTPGSYAFTISASDTIGCAPSRAYTMNVVCMTVSPATLTAATSGVAYTKTFTKTGGTGAVTWSLTGTLPAGMSFNALTAILSGTPTQTGSFPLTVTATDSASCPVSVTPTLVVN
jgi:hypothetical protein